MGGYFVFARDLTQLKRSEALTQEITARRRVWVGVRDADEEALVQVADSGPGVP